MREGGRGKTLVIVVALVAAGFFAAYLRFRPYLGEHATFTDGSRRYGSTVEERIRYAVWDDPRPLPPVVNTPSAESAPTVSPDGRWLVYAGGEVGLNAELYVAELVDGEPVEPCPLVVVNSDADETAPIFGPDGLYFASNRWGGRGGLDLYVAPYRHGVFELPRPLGPGVNTSADESDPAPVPGTTSLTFASNRPRGARVDWDLYVARARPPDAGARPDPAAGRGAAPGADAAAASPSFDVEPFTTLNTPFDERDPAYSADGTQIVFASDRTGSRGRFDLWRSLFTGGAWLSPEPLEGLNTAGSERTPRPSLDGFTLLYTVGGDLVRARSRELFRVPGRPVGWLDLTILVMLLLVALLAALAKRWERLDVLYKCVLVSLLVHAVLLWWLRDVYVEAERWPLAGGEHLFKVKIASSTRQTLSERAERAGRLDVARSDAARAAPDAPARHEARRADAPARAASRTVARAPARPARAPARAPAPTDDPRPAELARGADVRAPAADAPRLVGSAPAVALAARAPAAAPSTRDGASAPARADAGAGAGDGPAEPGAAGLERADPVPAPAPGFVVAGVAPVPTERAVASARGRAVDGPRDAAAASTQPAPALALASRTSRPDRGGTPPPGRLAEPAARSSGIEPALEAGAARVLVLDGGAPGDEAALPAPRALSDAGPRAGAASAPPALATDAVASAPETGSAGAASREASGQLALVAASLAAHAAGRPGEAPAPRRWREDGGDDRGDAPRPGLLDEALAARPADPADGPARALLDVAPATPVPDGSSRLPGTDGPASAPATADASRRAEDDGVGARGDASTERPGRIALAPRALAAAARPAPSAPARWGGPARVPTLHGSSEPGPGALPAGLLAAPALAALPADRAADRRWQRTPYRSRFGLEKERALLEGGGSAETEAAVASGLAYLASRQKGQGHWGSSDDYDGKYGHVVIGKTGLAVLAFLGAGHTPSSGTRYGETVRRGVDFLLGVQDADTGHFGYTSSYSHGIATYALAECHALTREARLRAPLEHAVEQILRHQHRSRDPRRHGGWGYYYPDDRVFDSWPRASVTVWQVMALESARLGGLSIDDEAFRDARDFLRGAQDPRYGYFRYSHDPDRLGSAFRTLPGSTPASLFALELLDVDTSAPRFDDAYDFVLERVPRRFAAGSETAFVREAAGNIYFWYYGSLALFRAGGERWEAWNRRLKQTLLPAQLDDGSWPVVTHYASYAGDTTRDRSYTTAMCVLTLEVYYRYFTPLLSAGVDEDPAPATGGRGGR